MARSLAVAGRPWAESDLCATMMILFVVGILPSWTLLGV